MTTSTSASTSVSTRPVRAGRREFLALGLAAGTNLFVLALWYGLTLGGISVAVWLKPEIVPPWHVGLAAMPAGEVLPVSVAEHGRDVFRSVCGTCHGPSGFGMRGLGKDLVHSDFVADGSDAVLLGFIEKGRAADDPLNSTKIAMPPMGGNPALTRDDLQAVVAYLRGLQDPRRMPALAAWTPKPIEVTEADQAAALTLARGDPELAAYIASGDKLFHSTCVACHGQRGVGVAGNGKALVNNPFIQSLDDDALLAFVKQGRAPTDPKNTTGIQMPPKGGNPAMSDDDILDVISYLRTLQPDGYRVAADGK